MNFQRILASVGFLLIFYGCASRAPVPDTPAQLRDNYEFVKKKLTWLIDKEMAKQKITGLSIALVSGNDTIWLSGFGYADKKKRRPVTPSTRFRAGSLVKPLNAIATLALQESQGLDIAAPLTTYLPAFSPPSRFSNNSPINLRHCLTHLSGLPSDLINGMWEENKPAHFLSTLGYINAQYVAQPPDTVFRYSNLAHNLVAAVIEQQSGENYAEHMAALLALMGMNNSAIASAPPLGTAAYDKGRARKVFALRDVPAAGLITNAEDLAKLLLFFNRTDSQTLGRTEPPLLSAQSLALMLQDYTGHLPLNLGKRHGLGLVFYDGLFHPSISLHGHGGASVNHRAVFKFSANKKVGVALLSNSKNSSGVLHKIANEALALLLQAKLGKPAPKNTPYWPQPGKKDIVATEQLVGHYATAGGLAKIFQHKNNHFVEIAGRKIKLFQREKNGFHYLEYKLFGLFSIDLGYFSNLAFSLRDINGKLYLVSKNTLGIERLVGSKIYPKPIPQAWHNRRGAYRLVTELAAIDIPKGGIKVEDGFLVAYAKTEDGDALSVVLEPTNNTEAIVLGLGRGLGETVSVVEEGGEEFLMFSNLRFQRRSQM